MINQVRAQLHDPSDLLCDLLNNGFFTMELCYFPALCDQSAIDSSLIAPFSHYREPEDLMRLLAANPFVQSADQPEIWADLLLKGAVLCKLEGRVLRLEAPRKLQEKPDTVQIEAALQGPQTAFTEDIDLNLAMVRMRYNEPTLCVEERIIGDSSKTRVAVLYDHRLVNTEVLKLLNDRLSKARIRTLRAAGQLLQDLSGRKHRLFPIILQTERADRTATMLERGKIAVLQDGSRFGLLLPVRLFDFLHAMDDDYESFWMSKILLVLRYIAMTMTIMLPAFYIAIVSYNPEVLRVQLTLSIAGSRVVVPYPSFIEVFIMLFMIEALIEASLRLPKYIGNTATTVGGLILGQSIQQAGLVSSIMIIVTSVVAISNFVIPNNGFGYSVRFVKYIFVMAAIFYGLLGIFVLFFALIVYWCSLRSFGQPYLAIYTEKHQAGGSVPNKKGG